MCYKNDDCKETITIELSPRDLLELYAKLRSSSKDDELLDLLEDAVVDALWSAQADHDVACKCCEQPCLDCRCDDMVPQLYLSDFVDSFPVLILNDEGKATRKLYVEDDGNDTVVFYTTQKGKYIEEFKPHTVLREDNTLHLEDKDGTILESFYVSDKSFERLEQIFESGISYEVTVGV